MLTPEEYLETLPLLVSFPRSGCNWFQAVMELYFNRHRVWKLDTHPSWMEGPIENPMWMHTHDPNRELVTSHQSIFMWRHPPDAIFSLSQLLKNDTQHAINQWCMEFIELYKKWTLPENEAMRGGQPVLILNYDEIRKDNNGQMQRVSEFFNKPFDLELSKNSFETVGGIKQTNAKGGGSNFKNPNSGSDSYEEYKKQWKIRWEDYILDRTLRTL